MWVSRSIVHGCRSKGSDEAPAGTTGGLVLRGPSIDDRDSGTVQRSALGGRPTWFGHLLLPTANERGEVYGRSPPP